MSVFSKVPGTLAKGLRTLSTHADKIKPGEILRAGAQRLEAVSPESYYIRLAELRATEDRLVQLAGSYTLKTPEPPPEPIQEATEVSLNS